MIRTEDKLNRTVGESQSPLRFWSWNIRQVRCGVGAALGLPLYGVATMHNSGEPKVLGALTLWCLNDAPCPPLTSHGASIMLQ
jgi:hypothetical protein